ncbi:hypothetical protein PanWU01x14_028240, partial [Parasponia andersonii]
SKLKKISHKKCITLYFLHIATLSGSFADFPFHTVYPLYNNDDLLPWSLCPRLSISNLLSQTLSPNVMALNERQKYDRYLRMFPVNAPLLRDKSGNRTYCYVGKQ